MSAREIDDRTWGVVLLLAAFLGIHAQLLVFTGGFFGVLHADEIADVVGARDRIDSGDYPVLTHPAGHLDGGGIAMGYALAALPLRSPRATTFAVRALAVLMSFATLALWSRWWIRNLAGWRGLLPGLLLLFPQEGWITNSVQAFGAFIPGFLAAALAVNVVNAPDEKDRGRSAPRTVGLGALLSALALIAPASAPTIAAVVFAGAWRRRGGLGGGTMLAWLAEMAAGGASAAAALLTLDGVTEGVSPLRTWASFLWRPGREGGQANALTLVSHGVTNLFVPTHVWLMPWPIFYALLGLALAGALGSRRAASSERWLVLVHAGAATVTIVAHLVTRFAEDASWNVTPILPHLIGLAGLALARAISHRGVARIAASVFLGLWVTSGVAAYQERFTVTTPDLRYPAIAVERAVLPHLQATSGSARMRVASTYHWAEPLAFERPDLEVCCVARSLCRAACAPDFFAGGPALFLLPGPAAHAHGEPGAASLAPRLLESAKREGLALEVERLTVDGRWHRAVDDATSPGGLEPDTIAIVATTSSGDQALATLLAPE